MTEQQLRKALGAANDLEPPADELFAQRALQRGRARTARRRHTILGAAAGVALVSVLGGTWLSSQQLGTTSMTQSGSADSAGREASGAGGQDASEGFAPASPGTAAPQRDTSAWLAGRETRQRAVLDELVPTLTTTYPDVFGGAYATDETNTRIVVTVTRHDAGLETLVRSSMPSPDDVSFAVVANTAVRKQEVATRIVGDAPGWLAKGVTVVAVRPDARSDRVVVTVREEASLAAVEQRYGSDIVRAEVGVGPPLGGVLTDPGLPTPDR